MKKLSFLTRTSLMLGFFFALDKILAFTRSIIIARQFSLSFELDAFNVANNLPDLLFALISGGALAMAFMPVLIQAMSLGGRQAAWALFSRVANLAFVSTAGLAVIIAAFAEQIVRSQIGIAPGFGVDQQRLIADLMRLNLIATCIFSLSGLVMASLQANQHFLLPALAPTLYNLGQIFGALVLSPKEAYTIGPITLPHFGLGVHGLVYGVILGAALHLAVQIPGLVRYGFRWTPSFDVRDPGLIEVFKVVGPRLLTMLLIQLMFVARDNFASRLGQVGAISSLTYGWMIMQVPETLIGTAIATAMLPTLSKYAARADWAVFRRTIEKAVRILLALTLPAAAILAVGLRPLVQFAFRFDVAGTNMLTWTARVYLLTLTGYAIQEIMARSFYARKEAWWPFYAVTIRMAIYLAIGVTVIRFFRRAGAPGIALAELALTAEAVIMFVWLNHRLPERITAGMSLLRGAGGALIGGAAAYVLAVAIPGAAVPTALIGMTCGGLLTLPFIWKELRLLFDL